MSLPYILSTARKLGIPVVITNERGESAQVVMPFEDFASMVNGVQPHSHEGCCSSRADEETGGGFDLEDELEDEWVPEEAEEGSYELTPEEIEELDKIIIEDEKGEGEPQATEKTGKEQKEKESMEPTSVSLEDQFYFEPLPSQEGEDK